MSDEIDLSPYDDMTRRLYDDPYALALYVHLVAWERAHPCAEYHGQSRLAEEVGWNAMTVQRAADRLEAEGLLLIAKDGVGSKGRPCHRYRLAPTKETP